MLSFGRSAIAILLLCGVAFAARTDPVEGILGAKISESLATAALFAAILVFLGFIRWLIGRQDRAEKARAEREERRLKNIVDAHAMREAAWLARLERLDTTLDGLAHEISTLRGR